jgi:hypothetical protein
MSANDAFAMGLSKHTEAQIKNSKCKIKNGNETRIARIPANFSEMGAGFASFVKIRAIRVFPAHFVVMKIFHSVY